MSRSSSRLTGFSPTTSGPDDQDREDLPPQNSHAGSASSPATGRMNMLDQLAHPMAVPFSTRKSAQAAALTLSLIGYRPASADVDSAGPYVAVRLPGISLWATRCDAPLLLDKAVAAAGVTGRDVLLLRLGIGSRRLPPVTFDWVQHDPQGSAVRRHFFPALPHGGGFALVPTEGPPTRLRLAAEGLSEDLDSASSSPLENDLAVARATAIFRSHLWGGL